MKKKSFLTAILSIAMAFILMFTPLSVGAVKADAASVKSQITAVVKAKKPAKVSSLSYTATINSVTIKWSKVKNASGYRVYQKKGDKWKEVKTVNAKTTSLTVKGLKAATSYSFKVRAYIQKGSIKIWGDNSKVLTCKTKAITKVTISSTSATKDSVTLKWGKIAGATGYRVYQKKDGKWVKLADTKSCSYTVKKLKSATSYSFCVKAYKTANNKTTWYEASKAVTVKTTTAQIDKEQAVKEYNNAINNAKKLKNGTITYNVSIGDLSVEAPEMISNLLKSMLEDGSSKTTYKIKNGKDLKTGYAPDDILPPENKKISLSASDVASAVEKKTDNGSTITIKLKKEVISYDGEKAIGGAVHKKALGLDLGLNTSLAIYEMVLPETIITATLDTKGRLTKLTVKSPSKMTVAIRAVDADTRIVLQQTETDTYTIKY